MKIYIVSVTYKSGETIYHELVGATNTIELANKLINNTINASFNYFNDYFEKSYNKRKKESLLVFKDIEDECLDRGFDIDSIPGARHSDYDIKEVEYVKY